MQLSSLNYLTSKEGKYGKPASLLEVNHNTGITKDLVRNLETQAQAC